MAMRFLIAAMFCLFSVIPNLPAYTNTVWLGSESNEWSDDNNWTLGEPATGSTAFVKTGTPVITEPDEYVHYNLYAGYESTQSATITLLSGDLYVGSHTYLGNHGSGTFNQYDGEFDAMLGVTFGRYSDATGTYNMEGGILNGDINVRDGTGVFNHYGGTVNGGSLRFPYSSSDTGIGTYNAYNGADAEFSAIQIGDSSAGSGTLNILGSRAYIKARSQIVFGESSSFSATANSKIRISYNSTVGGNFIVKTDDESALSDFRNLSVIFTEGLSSDFSEFELAGEDMGEDFAGFCGNFDIDKLVVGEDGDAFVKLVDNIDNGNRGGTAEALYVRKIVVKAGSQLDLNNLNVYCLEPDVQGTLLNGSPVRMWAVDTNNSGFIDEADLVSLGLYWLQSCSCGSWCGGADIDRNYTVDFDDFAVLAQYWYSSSGAVFYSEPLDSDPGWTREGQWAFGVPTGSGGTYFGNPDPSGGYTGSNVFGVNLNGDYELSGGYKYLTSELIDCTGKFNVHIRFKRWLNCASTTSGSYHVFDAYDDSFWDVIWYNDSGAITDSDWTEMVIDVSEQADNNPNFRLRWRYNVTGGGAYSGWNIDDIELLEVP